MKCLNSYIILFLFSLPFALSSSRHRRVINGDVIPITKAPYMAALIEEESVGHVCGGAIISSRVIATAAHCLPEPSLITQVRVGSENDLKGGQLYEVKKVVSHSRFSSGNVTDGTYDYGVVILKKSLKFNKSVQRAILAKSPLPEGTMLALSGWGGGHELHQTTVPIYDQSECVNNYAQIPIKIDLKVQVCAGFQNANTSTCFGDSGGPLVYGNRLLYGVVSWGNDDCAVVDYPGIFSRIDTMREWFQSFMDEYK